MVGWDFTKSLVGHAKGLDFIPSVVRSHLGSLNRGMTRSHFYVKRLTVVSILKGSQVRNLNTPK